MRASLHNPLIVASSFRFGFTGTGTFSQNAGWERSLETIAVLALLVSALSFLFLVWRVCSGLQQCLLTCLQRARTEQGIAEMLREYLETQRLTNEQLWSASSALSPC